MRRIAAPLVLVLIVLVACDSSSAIRSPDGLGWVHWQQDTPGNLERHVEVLLPAALGSDGAFLRGLNAGILQINRSPYLDFRLDVGGRCEGHCITVSRAPINGASTTWGWDSHGHMFGLAARIVFDSDPWTAAVLANAACHELFHAAGLRHGTDHNRDGRPDVQGPCQAGIATVTDLENIVVTTGHPDPVIFTSGVGKLRGPPMRRTIHHSRAQLEELARRPA